MKEFKSEKDIIENLEALVTKHFKVRKEELYNRPSREMRYIEPMRTMVYYLRQYNFTVVRIGQIMNLHHTSVIHHTRQFETLKKFKPLKQISEDIEEEIEYRSIRISDPDFIERITKCISLNPSGGVKMGQTVENMKQLLNNRKINLTV